jgi:hypothetical protein
MASSVTSWNISSLLSSFIRNPGSTPSLSPATFCCPQIHILHICFSIVRLRQIWACISNCELRTALRPQFRAVRLCFQGRIETKVATADISLNTKDVSSTRHNMCSEMLRRRLPSKHPQTENEPCRDDKAAI